MDLENGKANPSCTKRILRLWRGEEAGESRDWKGGGGSHGFRAFLAGRGTWIRERWRARTILLDVGHREFLYVRKGGG